jgi:hypothetical protein
MRGRKNSPKQPLYAPLCVISDHAAAGLSALVVGEDLITLELIVFGSLTQFLMIAHVSSAEIRWMVQIFGVSNRQARVEYLCAKIGTVVSLDPFLLAQEVLNFGFADSHRLLSESDARETAPLWSHGTDFTPVSI